MKKSMFYLLGLLLALSMFSCKKDNDPANYFSFNGTKYTITGSGLIKAVFYSGTEDEFTIYQFAFDHIKGQDTTSLYVAVFDTLTNVLDGNYLSIDILSDQVRGILPLFTFLRMANGDEYYNGEGGSMDVSKNNTTYNVTFNTISAGYYSDPFDSNEDGNSGYVEMDKITGEFHGNINMQVVFPSAKSGKVNERIINGIRLH
jgi:hypothetical protein